LNKQGKSTAIMKNNSIDEVPFADILSSEFLIGNVGAPFIIGVAVGYFA
jgi:hypothetical protein